MTRISLVCVLTICFGVLSFNAQAKLRLQNDKIPDDLEISLTRKYLGGCNYSLLITANGDVFFDVKNCVSPKEKVAGKINQKVVKQMLIEFEKADFFELKDSYVKEKDRCGIVLTDKSYEIISIKINGKFKTVKHYLGCWKISGDDAVERITQLGRKIDELSGWKELD